MSTGTFICSKCSTSFPNRDTLAMHVMENVYNGLCRKSSTGLLTEEESLRYGRTKNEQKTEDIQNGRSIPFSPSDSMNWEPAFSACAHTILSSLTRPMSMSDWLFLRGSLSLSRPKGHTEKQAPSPTSPVEANALQNDLVQDKCAVRRGNSESSYCAESNGDASENNEIGDNTHKFSRRKMKSTEKRSDKSEISNWQEFSGDKSWLDDEEEYGRLSKVLRRHVFSGPTDGQLVHQERLRDTEESSPKPIRRKGFRKTLGSDEMTRRIKRKLKRFDDPMVPQSNHARRTETKPDERRGDVACCLTEGTLEVLNRPRSKSLPAILRSMNEAVVSGCLAEDFDRASSHPMSSRPKGMSQTKRFDGDIAPTVLSTSSKTNGERLRQPQWTVDGNEVRSSWITRTPPLKSSIQKQSAREQITYPALTHDSRLNSPFHKALVDNVCRTDESSKLNARPERNFAYFCGHCEIGFERQPLYTLHMGLHCVDQPWKCNMCGHVCSGVYEFTAHTLHF